MLHWLKKNRVLFLIPLAGILLFIILYWIATLYYPGGNAVHTNAVGFSWQHNYWCNLYHETAINGSVNPAAKLAKIASGILSVSVGLFWFLLPLVFSFKNNFIRTLQTAGVLVMIGLFFLPYGEHDLVINLTGFIASVALYGTLRGLYRIQWKILFYWGIFNIFCIVVNNLFYYTPGWLYYLPVVQKISFMSFLSWVMVICMQLFRKAPNI